MTATLTNTAQNERIQTFIDLFKQGVEAWIKAGEILVELVEDDPHVYDYIIQECPTLNAGILGRFEQMGRKILHPQLLLSASPGFNKLRRLPISMQERYITEPVPIIVHTGEGTDVLLVKAKDMTKEQADQVFAPGRIRTEGEQKAWLMEKASHAARPVGATSCPWKIRGKQVEIGGVLLSKTDLLSIAMQMG